MLLKGEQILKSSAPEGRADPEIMCSRRVSRSLNQVLLKSKQILKSGAPEG
jgi:hypothetical protein